MPLLLLILLGWLGLAVLVAILLGRAIRGMPHVPFSARDPAPRGPEIAGLAGGALVAALAVFAWGAPSLHESMREPRSAVPAPWSRPGSTYVPVPSSQTGARALGPQGSAGLRFSGPGLAAGLTPASAVIEGPVPVSSRRGSSGGGKSPGPGQPRLPGLPSAPLPTPRRPQPPTATLPPPAAPSPLPPAASPLPPAPSPSPPAPSSPPAVSSPGPGRAQDVTTANDRWDEASDPGPVAGVRRPEGPKAPVSEPAREPKVPRQPKAPQQPKAPEQPAPVPVETSSAVSGAGESSRPERPSDGSKGRCQRVARGLTDAADR